MLNLAADEEQPDALVMSLRVREEKIRLLESELQSAYKALADARQAATKLQSEFIANVSHEIRTPLNAIVGYAELLQEELHDVLSDRQRRYIQTMTTNSYRLLALLNDVLDLAKVNAGTFEVHREPVNLRKLLHEVYEVFVGQIGQKGLSTTLAIDQTLPELIELDGMRLKQALFNLLDNAIKFTERGYIHLVARNIVDSQQAHHLLLEVADSGIGVPESRQEAIFQTFWQHDSSSTRQYGGVGLGLAITKHLVESMDGSISLRSEVNKGSVFSIWLRNIHAVLPAQEELFPNFASSQSGKQFLYDLLDRQAQPRFQNVQVIIADDVEADRLLLADLLRQFDIHPFLATTGRQAMELVAEHAPNLVFVSCALQEVGAFDIGLLLKSSKTMGHIAVIGVIESAVVRPSATQLNTYNALLAKPFHKADILALLLRLVSASQVQMPDADSAASAHELLEKHTAANYQAMPDLLQEHSFNASDVVASFESNQFESEQSKLLQTFHHVALSDAVYLASAPIKAATHLSDNDYNEASENVSNPVSEAVQQELCERFLQQWQALKTSMIFDEVEAFAGLLLAFADEHQWGELRLYARRVEEQARLCQMQTLPATLEQFAAMLP
jgi:signal transduction histidine kinase/CheY-like chemotaxis protein